MEFSPILVPMVGQVLLPLGGEPVPVTFGGEPVPVTFGGDAPVRNEAFRAR